MYCPHCGYPNSGAEEICPDCKKPLTARGPAMSEQAADYQKPSHHGTRRDLGASKLNSGDKFSRMPKKLK